MLKIKKSITGICWHVIWQRSDGEEILLLTTDRKWQAQAEKSRLERSVVFNI